MSPAASEAQRVYDQSQLSKAVEAAEQVSGASALALLHQVETTLRSRQWPSLLVTLTQGGVELDRYDLVCPHCRQVVRPEDLRTVDIAERWTRFDEFDFAEQVASILYDDPGEFDGVAYMHYADDSGEEEPCFGFVSLPDGWSEDAK